MEEKLETVRREYGSTLSDLKINSKPHINTLTMLAEEYTPYASEVVRLIENRLQKVPDIVVQSDLEANTPVFEIKAYHGINSMNLVAV